MGIFYQAENLIKKNSILVAGSYGKTTITGLLSYIFLQLNLDPSYMFGGEPQDNFFPTNFGKSEWSIIEADENHNGLDTQTTFLYYPVKYLILTSAYWEHKDSYTSAEASLQAYLKLIKNVPEDGVIIYNGNDPDLQKIIHQSHAKTINYQNGEKYKSRLIGQYNQENIAAAFCLSKYLNFDTENVLLAIASFPGIKRRLEIISETKNIIFIDDFAQSPNRVLSAIQAITYSYPKRNIHVYFESRATFLQNKESLRGFQKITPFISDFILGKLQFSAKINKDHRASALDWQTEIGTKCKYLPIDNEVSKYFQDTLKPNDILVHFSSGGLQGLETYQQIVTYFQK